MSLFLNVLAASILGALILDLLGLHLKVGEFVALAFGLGSGAITLAVFGAMAVFGAPFAKQTEFAAVFALFALLLPLVATRALRSGRRFFAGLIEKPIFPSGLDRALALILLLLIAYTALIALYWPPWTWDALAIWVVKARAIFLSQSLGGHLEGAYPSYPLHVPLQLAILRLNSPEPPTQILFPVYAAGLLFVVTSGLIRLGQTRNGLFFTLLLAATPVFITYASTAYADMPYTFYYVSSALCLLAFFKGGQITFAFLSALLAGITAWTRPEGVLSLILNYAAVLAYLAWTRSKASLAAALLYPVGFSFFWAPWAYYTQLHGYGSYVANAGAAALRQLISLQVSLGRLFTVLKYFAGQWFAFEIWGSVWLVFGLSLIKWRAVRQHPFLLILIFLNIAALLFTYYATPEAPPLQWWLETGFARMALHFVPLLWVYVALAWDSEFSEAVDWGLGQARAVFGRLAARR